MAINKVKTGWQAEFKAGGRKGKKVKKTFKNKRDAQAFELEEKAKALHGDYQKPQKNKRKLLDLVEDWFTLHGSTLKDGAKRKTKLIATCAALGNPLADKFTAEDWLIYRNARLQEKTRSGTLLTANAINHEQRHLSAVYGQLIKLRNWKLENPLQGIQQIKEDEPDLIFLELSQLRHLLAACEQSRNPDLLVKVKLCLATGARWGEAEKLTAMQVKHGKAHYIKTKTSHARAVPITASLESELLAGRPRSGPLFKTSASAAFKGAIEAAGIVLPKGQLTHVLRHTFASHYMINDGNILKLQKALGHKTLAMTMRYAKLAPRHLEETLRKNPLASLESEKGAQKGNANEEITLLTCG